MNGKDAISTEAQRNHTWRN